MALPGEKEFDEIESFISKTLKSFEKALEPINREILEDVLNLLSEFTVSGGNLVPSISNLRKTVDLKKSIQGIIDNSDYPKEVREYLRSYNKTSGLTNDFFLVVSREFSPAKALYQEIVKSNIQITRDTMLRAGVPVQFSEAISESLKTNIESGASLAETRANVSRLIIKEPQLTRYASQVADDALNQFSRNYIEIVSADIGLDHYLYKGTRIGDSRVFCVDRIGKFFTQKEVQDWGRGKGVGRARFPWQGMIRGTNTRNIFTYLGGWRCRHRLMPVSDQVYKENTDG